MEEKNRSGAYFPPVHEQPNLGKRVSVNLCHIAWLRIPIVPLIESFHFEKAFKRAENILHPAPVRTHLHLYTHTFQFRARSIAYTSTHMHNIRKLRMEVDLDEIMSSLRHWVHLIWSV